METQPMDVSTLPFNQHLGLRVGSANGRPAVVLRPGGHHLNHVGTVHAAAVYGLAEAASGQCLLGRFPDLVDSHVAVLRSAAVKYRRPAAADAQLRARGALDEETAVAAQEKLDARGRATVDVEVSVTQNDTEVFSGTFRWFVAARDP